ncbi:hypothetical protein MMC18_004255 [Xylographa bjoerkii]|nr:hypothetical protein [Xylographa bjoerkii]
MSDFRQATRNLNNPAKAASDFTVFKNPILAAEGLGVAVSVGYLANRVLRSSPKPVASKSAGQMMGEFARDNQGKAGAVLALGAGYGLYKFATKSQNK